MTSSTDDPRRQVVVKEHRGTIGAVVLEVHARSVPAIGRVRHRSAPSLAQRAGRASASARRHQRASDPSPGRYRVGRAPGVRWRAIGPLRAPAFVDSSGHAPAIAFHATRHRTSGAPTVRRASPIGLQGAAPAGVDHELATATRPTGVVATARGATRPPARETSGPGVAPLSSRRSSSPARLRSNFPYGVGLVQGGRCACLRRSAPAGCARRGQCLKAG
jgi:hypothetical protein